MGTTSDAARACVRELMKAITDNFIFMSVESAEMTKHALNAFLALSITFANEIASLCELVGADGKEVESGLKSEQRIGGTRISARAEPFPGERLRAMWHSWWIKVSRLTAQPGFCRPSGKATKSINNGLYGG